MYSLSEYEEDAKLKIDPAVYDYIAGGAGSEQTLRNNEAIFSLVRIIPRMLVGVDMPDTGIELLGSRLSTPILIAPMAFHKLVHPEGEVATARAAKSQGIISIASTMSTINLEAIAPENPDLSWFQIYVFKNRNITKNLIHRAQKAGYKALVVTVDVPQMGIRKRDIKNQFKLPAHLQPANFIDFNNKSTKETVISFTATTFDSKLTWDDITWLQSITTLPIIIKGILAPEDVKIALNYNVAGIILSNHGGRQTDSAVTALEMLPEAVNIIQGRIPLMIDGGIRCGTDVFKALSLGANAVLIGRPILWGLASGGQLGVQNIIDLLQKELVLTMQFCGCKNINEITNNYVRAPFCVPSSELPPQSPFSMMARL